MKVQIVSPCTEDWKKMKIGLISRHCDKCDKPVMNFTKMNRAEIITYLLSNPQGEVCGRMNRDQFDFHHDDIPILIEALKKKGGNTSFLILALVCISLVGCKEDNQSTSIKTPNPIHHTDNTGATVGKVINTHDTLKKKKDKTIECVKPGPPQVGWGEPYPIVGEIVMPEPPMYEGGIELIDDPDISSQNNEDEILTFAEKMPEYPEGITALFAFIQKNLKYPEYEREAGISGTVYVKFVVSKEGKVKSPEIVRGISSAPNFSIEVLRIVNIMSDWIPGENNGKKVNVYYTIPVKFRLD